MGIYITGLLMPEKPVTLRIMPDGKVWMMGGRDRKLEAVEVKEPHGRLIDGTDLYAVLDGGFDIDLDELPETKDALLCMIQSAETIVEEEEVSDNG